MGDYTNYIENLISELERNKKNYNFHNYNIHNKFIYNVFHL